MNSTKTTGAAELLSDAGMEFREYRDANPDLSKFNDEQLAQHFILHGYCENRPHSSQRAIQLNIERRVMGKRILALYGWADQELKHCGIFTVGPAREGHGAQISAGPGGIVSFWRDDVSDHLGKSRRGDRFGFIALFDIEGIGEQIVDPQSFLMMDGRAWPIGDVQRDTRPDLDIMIEIYRNLEANAVYDELLLILNESRDFLALISDIHASEISEQKVHAIYDSGVDRSPKNTVCAVVLGNAAQLKAWMLDLCDKTQDDVAIDLICNGPFDAANVISAAKWLGTVKGRQTRLSLAERNLGFNGGVNYLISRVRSPYALVTNTDVRYQVLNFEHLEKLADQSTIVAPLQFNSMGAAQHLGLSISWEIKLVHGRLVEYIQSELVGRNTFVDTSKIEDSEVQFFGAAAFYGRTQILADLGPFDMGVLYAYHEDTDLALRHRSLGRSVIVSPALDLVHYESSASEVDLPKTFLIAANTLRMGHKLRVSEKV